MESFIQSGSAELCGVMNQYFSSLLTREVCYISECIATTVKNGGRGVMVWGAFSAAGTGDLLHNEKSITALEYRRILQKGLLPTIEKEQSDVVFQQDNALVQTAKTTKT